MKTSHIIDLKIERSVIIGLLYIINHNKYLEYYKDGFMKYMPYGLLSRIKPKIIEDIVGKDYVIGKVAGVNLKPIDFDSKEDLDEYIIGLRKLGIEEFHSLYLEEISHISKESIEYMEDSLNLKISKDEDIRISYIPLVIKNIYNLLGEQLQDKEVLIISRDKEVSKNIIKLIGIDIKFITNLGCSLEENEEIYNYIFEETGLSIFHSSDINKILGKYSIIINVAEDFNLEFAKIRRNAIIFDFSSISGLNSITSNSERPIISIRDFGFKLEDIGINKNKWLGDWIHSDLYGFLNGDLSGKVRGLYIQKEFLYVNDYVNSFIKLKGKL